MYITFVPDASFQTINYTPVLTCLFFLLLGFIAHSEFRRTKFPLLISFRSKFSEWRVLGNKKIDFNAQVSKIGCKKISICLQQSVIELNSILFATAECRLVELALITTECQVNHDLITTECQVMVI